MNPKVSVIVPVYNNEKYLSCCIDSILNQTFRDIEVILVDDGSTDKSGEICDNYTSIDNRVKVIHQNNTGYWKARKPGRDSAKGEYLLFVDHDDWCESNMIEKLYDGITKNEADIAVCGYSVDFTKSNYSIKKNFEKDVVTRNMQEFLYILENKGMSYVFWNKLYKGDIIKRNRIEMKNFGPSTDYIFNIDYFKNMQCGVLLKDELYHYMKRGELTEVDKYVPNLLEIVQLEIQARKELYDFYDMTCEKHSELYGRLYVDGMSRCTINMYKRNCDLTNEQKKEFLNNIIRDNKLKDYMLKVKLNSFHDKLFCKMIRIGNPAVMHSFYTVLAKLRYKMGYLYRKFRRLLIKDYY